MLLENYTALYSPLDIEYNQAMSGPYEDLRILHIDKMTNEGIGELIAGLKDNRITGFWRPMVCFGNNAFQREHIERLWQISDDIYYQDFLIDGRISPITKFLLEKGYKATPYYTQVIDLTKSVEELHADLRKSYKSLINSEEVEAINDITILKGMHYKARGRKTRSDETWNIQQKMINDGEAICLRCEDSIGLFYTGKVWSYYACGVGEKMHPVIWSAVKHAYYAKKSKFFEMGEQVFSGDEKLVNISKFKRGFGGFCEMRLHLCKDSIS